MRKVLLTGASGHVGQGFIEEYLTNYQKNYELILGIHKKKEKHHLKQRKIDLKSIPTLKKALKGIDVVVHLAAQAGPPSPFNEILEPNIIGAYNILEAARQAKCSRVVFASSVHTVKGYGKNHIVKHNEAPKPLNFYGASKVFGEALCYVFSSKYKMSCLAIRIGAYTSNDQLKTVCFSREDYEHVVSQRDLAQLIDKCIMAPKKIKYGILSGSSNNKKIDMDLSFTKKLVGYKPQDDAYKLCKKLKMKQ